MILPNLDIKGFRMNAGFRVQLVDGDVVSYDGQTIKITK